MRTLTHQVNDETVFVRIVSQPSEAGEFLDWIDSQNLVAVDTETTGLDLFSSSFRVRTVQFGNPREAWVIQVENSPELVEVSRVALTAAPQVVFHNATYDLLALEQGLGIKADLDKITDTKILAHLVDPREVKEGGKGLSLSDLTRAYVSEAVADEVKDSMTVMAKEHKLTKAKLFAEIDIDDPTYLLYAGMDVVLTSRLHKALTPKVPRVSRKLVPFEHKVAWACMALERQGFLLDVEYAERFSDELKQDQAHWENLALTKFGVEKVNSGDQVAAALKELGVKDFEHTPTGKPKVDSVLLESLIESGTPPQSALANAVLEAKKASKWRTTWVDKFLDNRDGQNYCHASIQPLRARTARMSITGIPAQTLPSKDWKVRRCFIAEPGNVIISADYQAQELRVLAALSGDRTMIQAFKNGDDLHQITADASGVERSVGKTVNFAYVYGSGPANIAKTCGISVPKAKQVIAGFESAYPGVKRLSDKLQQQARIKGWIETPTGRRIPVDKDRPYAALNYCFTGDTPVLTADLRHVRADTVKVGDELVGFDEHKPKGGRGQEHRRFRTSVVEAVSEVWKESVTVRTSDGKETVCSTDHKWLVRIPNRQPRLVWVDAKDLTSEMQLLSIGTWETAACQTSGYLAGLYDGEGCLGTRANGRKTTGLVFSQNTGLVMDAYKAAMDELGLRYSYYKRAPNSTSSTDTCAIAGTTEIMRTIGILRPKRFMPRVKEIFDGAAIVGGKQFDTPHIVSVEPAGRLKLTSIQTSTRTLVANGYLSHNCVQSTSRDITATALVKLYEAGFIQYVRLPIHDEIVASVPADMAENALKLFKQYMRTEFKGVLVDTDAELYGKSWAGGYITDPELLAQIEKEVP